MKRLYQKIYLTIIASLLLVVLVASTVWRLGGDRMPIAQAFEMAVRSAKSCVEPEAVRQFRAPPNSMHTSTRWVARFIVE